LAQERHRHTQKEDGVLYYTLNNNRYASKTHEDCHREPILYIYIISKGVA